MFARVVLERVVDNPFQTRQVYNGIEELAASILHFSGSKPETSGLIQVPPARVVIGDRVLDIEEYGGVEACLGDEPGAMVQLAAGHRRLRAFQYLCNGGSGDYATFPGGSGDYATFPVEIQVLDDQTMADIAWEENVRRKDLSSIEEAEAIRRAMEAFGWTQTEVGERWNLSQPAVANKLRLLQLPEDAQAAIRSGELGEKHGRALLKAWGKGQRIYELVARDIIPLPPIDERRAEKARELVGHHRTWKTSRSLLGESIRCEVCGGPVDDYIEVPTIAGDDRNIYLCLACIRAGQEWAPPSTAETEDLVERVIRRESTQLDSDKFPMDVEIGAKSSVLNIPDEPQVQAAKCLDCPLHEEPNEDIHLCLDSRCFRKKKELWYGHLTDRFHVACRKRWPGEHLPPVIKGWSGADLISYSDTVKAMVASGHCGPHCDRLRFRYNCSSGDIRPFAKMPFTYNCNNTNAYNACVKRYLKSLETEDQVTAEKLAAKTAEGRQKEAHAFLTRAEASIAKSLYEMEDGIWWALACWADSKQAKKGQTVAVSISQVAALLLRGNLTMRFMDWRKDDAVEYFQQKIRGELERMGIGLMPDLEELIKQMERIKGFLLDDSGLPRAGLTEEQVTGNMANLEKLAGQVHQVVESEQDRERLLGWIEELQALFPGK